MEAILLTLDVFGLTYICWRIFKLDPDRPREDDLGLLSFKPAEKSD